MLVVGLFAVLSWDSTFPDRRDVLVLAPLPVRARTLFLAKVAAVATALGLTVLALHWLAGLAWPLALAAAQVGARAGADLRSGAWRRWTPADLQAGHGPRSRAGAAGSGRSGAGDGDAGVAIGVCEHGVRRVFDLRNGEAGFASSRSARSRKTFTGLMLAQHGRRRARCDCDEPVRELLPPGTVAKPHGREITLLDLATHHSGLPRMPDNFDPRNPDNPLCRLPCRPISTLSWQPHGVAKPPDTRFLYSNLGFGLLGQALANRAGTTYPDLVRQEVTGPLGLNDTVVALSAEQQRRFMPGHNAEHRPVPAMGSGCAGGRRRAPLHRRATC